ncbi:hypothetical protein ACSBR2_036671 [Camellia fascicularis]
MANYHFVDKDVKGASNQWDDIQRKLGNLPLKPPAFKPPSFKVAEDEDSKHKDKARHRECDYHRRLRLSVTSKKVALIETCSQLRDKVGETVSISRGGNMRDYFLVNGVALKKTFSYAGFEQQPKKFLNTKILLLNVELELKSEKENAEIRLSDPSQYQSIVDAEWNIIYDKLDKCVKSRAKIVLSWLAIGDLATQVCDLYFSLSAY